MTTKYLYALERYGAAYDAADEQAMELVLGAHQTQLLCLQVQWPHDDLRSIDRHFERFLKGGPR